VAGVTNRPPTGFYVVAFAAVALSVAALVLSVQSEDSGAAAAAGLIAAAGCFVAAWMLKRSR
jgi:hypothetical protein